MNPTMSPTTSAPMPERIAVSTPAEPGLGGMNHSEGVVVSTAVKAGGQFVNHSEGVVVSTAVKAGGQFENHSEGVVDARPAPTTTDPSDDDGIIIEE